MNQKKINQLLKTHFADHADRFELEREKNTQLLGLENKVWEKIHHRQKTTSQFPGPDLEKLLQPFRTMPFQLASLTFALLFGILASSVFTQPVSQEQKITQLDMNIFTAKSHYLTVNLIERTQ